MVSDGFSFRQTSSLALLHNPFHFKQKWFLIKKNFHHYNWSLNWNVCNLTSHLLNRKDHILIKEDLKQSWNCFHIIESNLTMKKEFQCEPILCKHVHVLTFEWLHSYCIIHFPCFNIQKLYKFGSFKWRHTIVEILERLQKPTTFSCCDLLSNCSSTSKFIIFRDWLALFGGSHNHQKILK